MCIDLLEYELSLLLLEILFQDDLLEVNLDSLRSHLRLDKLFCRLAMNLKELVALDLHLALDLLQLLVDCYIN